MNVLNKSQLMPISDLYQGLNPFFGGCRLEKKFECGGLPPQIPFVNRLKRFNRSFDCPGIPPSLGQHGTCSKRGNSHVMYKSIYNKDITV